MKKSERNLQLLYALFVVFLVTANAIASKVFSTGISVFGSEITLTVGAICYPFTFLITDIIGEIWGKQEAKNAVKFGFLGQIVSTLFIIVARYLPAVDTNVQSSYDTLLGTSWVFVLASLGGFLISQSWDVYVFHKIRDKYIKKHGSRKGGRWIWNNASTITSQFLDTIVYAIIAFGFGFGWLFDDSMRPALYAMIVGQYLVKVVIAILDTPIFYLFTRSREDKKNED